MDHWSTPRVRSWRAPLCLLGLLGLLASCGAVRPGAGGRLLIVGGGLRTENVEVYRAFTGAADPLARLVVVPTASGVPAESGPGTARDLAPHLQPHQTLVVSALERDAFELAADPEHVAELEDAGGYWFTGGVQSRIVAVFRPTAGDSPAYGAVRGRLAAGAVVAGSSAGAAMMCDPMIAWGNSREALLVGVSNGVEDRAVCLEQGMGFFPYGMVDQHFLRRGRLGRLVVALEETEHELGFGVADNRALLVDLGVDLGTALGSAAVLVVDATELRRDGYSRLGLRVHLLGDGDSFDFGSGEVLPDGRKLPLPSGVEGVETRELLEPWGRDTVTRLLQRLAMDPTHEQRAAGDVFSLCLSADERTRFLAVGADLETLCEDVRLDIRAGAGAEALAAGLRLELEGGGAQP